MQRKEDKMKNKQIICAIVCGLLLISAAGIVETMPLISLICIIGMMICVKLGKLGEIKDAPACRTKQTRQKKKSDNVKSLHYVLYHKEGDLSI